MGTNPTCIDAPLYCADIFRKLQKVSTLLDYFLSCIKLYSFQNAHLVFFNTEEAYRPRNIERIGDKSATGSSTDEIEPQTPTSQDDNNTNYTKLSLSF